MPCSVSASSVPAVSSFGGWQSLLDVCFTARNGLGSGWSSLEAPSLGSAHWAELGFSEDKENPSGGARFNPQNGVRGSAAALVLVKGGEKMRLKALLGQEEIPTGLKDWE